MVEPEPHDGEEVERPVVLAPRLAFRIPRAIDALPAGLSGRAVTTERVPPMPGERDLFGAFGTGDLADERLVDAQAPEQELRPGVVSWRTGRA